MCGIAGILGLSDGFPVNEKLVATMADALAHRGPDDAGAWFRAENRIALGHRRLSIIDLSDSGHQPMSNEDGSVWIAYNGEVYNHAALRAELQAKGHVFRSYTDTEAIVHLYEEEGWRCVERLEGMFAFAVWDSRRRELFLARDRIGVKPLYYARLPHGLLFGSEIKALAVHPAFTRELDEESLFHYLTFAFAPTPRTLFSGVSKLAPAERMIVSADGALRSEIYWSPLGTGIANEIAEMHEVEIERRLLDLLRQSIAKRMMSDVPFGVFLSGGLDSSTNVALMADLAEQPVRTFSTAPAGHPKYDELEPARLVARHFGTDHHEVTIDEGDLLAFLPQLLESQDEPLSDWTCIPQHFVSKLARENGTPVIQVGEGADELFHGYKGYIEHRRYVAPFQRYLPALAQRGIAMAALTATQRVGRGVRHAEILSDASHSSIPYWGGSICLRGELKERVLGPTIGRYESSLSIPERIWREAEAVDPECDLFAKMTYVELKQRLAELLLQRLDRIAMLSSIEGREPFLDHQLVEFATALPGSLKYRKGTGKYVLRQAVRGIVPEEILKRRKQGFGTPMVEWLRGPFGRQAREIVRASTLVQRGAIDPAPVLRLFDEHISGRSDWSYYLWNIYNVCAWHDRWIAGRSVGEIGLDRALEPAH
jgi:asparagine synthase (glutamine-hydrolysing)